MRKRWIAVVGTVALAAVAGFAAVIALAPPAKAPRPTSSTGFCIRADTKPTIGVYAAEAVLVVPSNDAARDRRIASTLVGRKLPEPVYMTRDYWMQLWISETAANPGAGGKTFTCDALNLKLCGQTDCRTANPPGEGAPEP